MAGVPVLHTTDPHVICDRANRDSLESPMYKTPTENHERQKPYPFGRVFGIEGREDGAE